MPPAPCGDEAGLHQVSDDLPLLRAWTANAEKMAEAIKKLEDEMREAARKFEFERAAQLRDKARALRAKLVEAN